jgi:molybdopterin converting factor small subunit
MSRTESATRTTGETTVTVRCTGHVQTAVGESTLEYTFEGETLGDFLESFFETYDVADLIMAMEPGDESAPGWARPPEELPGTWRQNPEGERLRRYARVLVNGRFNEHMDGLRTTLADGDRVSLLYPFVYCV